jgi:hypothetical protein
MQWCWSFVGMHPIQCMCLGTNAATCAHRGQWGWLVLIWWTTTLFNSINHHPIYSVSAWQVYWLRLGTMCGFITLPPQRNQAHCTQCVHQTGIEPYHSPNNSQSNHFYLLMNIEECVTLLGNGVGHLFACIPSNVCAWVQMWPHVLIEANGVG